MINSRWFHVGCKFPACTRVKLALDARRIRWSHVSCKTVARLLYDGGTTGTTKGRYWRDIFVDLIWTNPTKHDAKPMTIWRQTTFMWHDDTRCPQISCRGTIVPLSYLCGRGKSKYGLHSQCLIQPRNSTTSQEIITNMTSQKLCLHSNIMFDLDLPIVVLLSLAWNIVANLPNYENNFSWYNDI